MSIVAYSAIVKKNWKFFTTWMLAWLSFFLIYAQVKHLFFLSNDQQQELSNTLAKMPMQQFMPKIIGFGIMYLFLGKTWFKYDENEDRFNFENNQGLDLIESFSAKIQKRARVWHLVIIPAILLCLSSFFRENLFLLSLLVALGFTLALSFSYTLHDATTRKRALLIVIYNLSLIPYYFYTP